MIDGLHFTSKEIAELENTLANKFFNSKDPLMNDALSYYSPLFREYLLQHASKRFTELSEKEQQDILTEEERRFIYSMTYSFSKGHMDCFTLILPDYEQKLKFTKSFFENPGSKVDFLNKIFTALPDETYQRKINKDRVYSLVQYTRDYFENGIYYITKLAKVFYMKGASVGYDQITQYVVKANVKITGYSKILHVPYNQSFAITPAFSATFDAEHLNTESWDISWDVTHSMEAQSSLIGKVILNRFTRQEINAYADVGAVTYRAIKDFFNTKSNDADPMDVLYQAQMIFTIPSNVDKYTPVSGTEYQLIMENLRNTMVRRLGIKSNQILVRI